MRYRVVWNQDPWYGQSRQSFRPRRRRRTAAQILAAQHRPSMRSGPRPASATRRRACTGSEGCNTDEPQRPTVDHQRQPPSPERIRVGIVPGRGHHGRAENRACVQR